jgi:hypothetical protein
VKIRPQAHRLAHSGWLTLHQTASPLPPSLGTHVPAGWLAATTYAAGSSWVAAWCALSRAYAAAWAAEHPAVALVKAGPVEAGGLLLVREGGWVSFIRRGVAPELALQVTKGEVFFFVCSQPEHWPGIGLALACLGEGGREGGRGACAWSGRPAWRLVFGPRASGCFLAALEGLVVGGGLLVCGCAWRPSGPS